jgi:hypothetical protein
VKQEALEEICDDVHLNAKRIVKQICKLIEVGNCNLQFFLRGDNKNDTTNSLKTRRANIEMNFDICF